MWVPTLYFTQAVPYAMVSFVSRVLYKQLDVSNTEITLYVGLLGWPWVIKPLWSPLVDILRTKRWWILITQVLLTAGLAGIAVAIPSDNFLFWSLLVFSVIALASATHDIAADGYYMLASSSHEQAFFVGIRSTFYRLGWIACQGLLVIFAGYQERITGHVPTAWSTTFYLAAGLFLMLAIYHTLILPRPPRDVASVDTRVGDVMREFGLTFASFFQKPHIGVVLAFLLFYRFAEAQLVALKSPFFLDPRDVGGLGLTAEQVGLLDGTIGVVMLLVGGILGGAAAAYYGLKAWIWWMALAINLPNLAYVYLSVGQPESFWAIAGAVGVEQFGYGFGFAGYMLYMLYVARGDHETAHYALCTGFMALGINIPGMWSGALQESIGYPMFFGWVMLSTVASFVVVGLVPLDASFGKREAE